MLKLLRFVQRRIVWRSPTLCGLRARGFADVPAGDNNSKQVVVQGTENEQRVRVRRARPADAPRVLQFVREHARVAWPAASPVGPSTSATATVLCDFIARTLAQGHSMLAEQHESRRGWLRIRGVSLGTSVCAWDAAMLERWARCLRCPRSRRLVHFSAHCLRGPQLHDKYHVHRILQVLLIVPPDFPRNADIIEVLARNSIQRGRDVGFPLLRFDVSNEDLSNALQNLKMKKEWHLRYDVQPDGLFAVKDIEPLEAGSASAVSTVSEVGTPETGTSITGTSEAGSDGLLSDKKRNFVSVFSVLTRQNESAPAPSKTAAPPSLPAPAAARDAPAPADDPKLNVTT